MKKKSSAQDECFWRTERQFGAPNDVGNFPESVQVCDIMNGEFGQITVNLGGQQRSAFSKRHKRGTELLSGVFVRIVCGLAS
jgi:hypothetical protein